MALKGCASLKTIVGRGNLVAWVSNSSVPASRRGSPVSFLRVGMLTSLPYCFQLVAKQSVRKGRGASKRPLRISYSIGLS